MFQILKVFGVWNIHITLPIEHLKLQFHILEHFEFCIFGLEMLSYAENIEQIPQCRKQKIRKNTSHKQQGCAGYLGVFFVRPIKKIFPRLNIHMFKTGSDRGWPISWRRHLYSTTLLSQSFALMSIFLKISYIFNNHRDIHIRKSCVKSSTSYTFPTSEK